jgi:hypothetical protein
MALCQKVPIPNGLSFWKLLDYAWLPEATSGQLIDHPDSGIFSHNQQPVPENNPPSGTHRAAVDPAVVDFEGSFVPNEFVHNLLGDDMGGLWTEIFSTYGVLHQD